MSERKPPPLCKAARTWLVERCGKGCLAPLTGGTSRVFSAYLHLVDAWLSGMRDEHMMVALRHTVAMLQRSEWPLAAEAIAHMGDWSHIEELWPQVKPVGAPFYAYGRALDRVVECDESVLATKVQFR